MEKGAGGARASEGGGWSDSDINGENRGRKNGNAGGELGM